MAELTWLEQSPHFSSGFPQREHNFAAFLAFCHLRWREIETFCILEKRMLDAP